MQTDTIIEETCLERAILDLLAGEPESYPSHIVGALRRRDTDLPLERTRGVLERLFVERRVARLWHRYLLARDVDAVRGKWLAMIDRQAERIDADPADPDALHDARDLITRWDGWRIEGCDFAA